jgi:Mrp family chromosome partitioning ATPase
VERVDSGADLVLIDAPPIGTAADALLLATRVDDVLLVVRPGHTTRRDLAITRQSLQQLAIVPTGLILVGARPIARTHIRR